MDHKWWKENRPVRFCCLMVRRYLRHGVGVQAAALAFYLLFMIFPFLIFLSALLGLLHLDVAGILTVLERVIPREAAEIIGVYLQHVQSHPSPQLAAFGLVFSIWFPMRSANTLMRAVRTAYHLGPPRVAFVHTVKSLVYTVLFIAAIALTFAALSVSDWILDYGVEHFYLPVFVAEIWAKLRFPAVGAVGFFALCGLYILAQDERPAWRSIWPGTVAALGGWLAISWLYNYYVENFASYSTLYGSIGAIIVVLIWLNLSAVVLIMGAEMNGVLMQMSAGSTEREERKRG